MNGRQGQNGRRRDEYPLSNISVNPGYEDAEGATGYPLQHAFSDTGPAVPLDERESDMSFYSEPASGVRQRGQWAKEEGPRDTAMLLESLPSKQLEMMANEQTRKNTWKKKSSRRKSLYGTLHVPRGKDVTSELLRNVQDDPDFADEVEHGIKEMTTSLSTKRKLRNEMTLKRKKPQNISRWKRFKYNCEIKWKHFKYNLAGFGYFLRLWEGHLKKIEGHFGTGVLSYFLFLKWLFYINIPAFVFTFGFVILPQILYRVNVEGAKGYNNISFTGKELLTGAYWFTDTEMYYGFYTSNMLNLIGETTYNMKYAYLFTCWGYYLLCLIILAISVSKSYKKNYIEGSGAFDFYYVTRVFCGWDYGITAKNSAKLKHTGILNELKEYLSGLRQDEEEEKFGAKCKWFFIRFLTNLLVLSMIGGSGYLIYELSRSKTVLNTDIPILSEMALALCVSGVNLILPFFFTLIARVESYKKPRNELYINMGRTMLLKAVSLAMMVFYWYKILNVPCWETHVGQDIYRLVIVDFIFVLFTTFFVEFIRRLLSKFCCKSLSYPEFEVGRNTLNLIYSQALCWLGTYFSPMLSAIMIIKLFLLFYVKRISVIQNCRPSLRPWRASRAHTIFLAFLSIFFILTTAAVTASVIFMKPSPTCGPFTNHTTSYEIVEELVDGWKEKYETLHAIVSFVSSTGFIAGLLVVLIALTYYMRIVMVGHKEMVSLLRQQVAMEGRDKAYLLRMLHDASKKHKGRPGTGTGRVSGGEAAASTITSFSPGSNYGRLTHTPSHTPSGSPSLAGGRQFIKQIASSGNIQHTGGTGTPKGQRKRAGRVTSPQGAASP